MLKWNAASILFTHQRSLLTMVPKYSAEDMMQSVNFNYGGHNFQLYTHNHPDHLFNVITAEKSFYELDLLVKAKEVLACPLGVIRLEC